MNRESSSSAEAAPPGPSGWPVIGSALESRRALKFLLENRRDYGDIVYYEFIDESIYQLNYPVDIEWILVENN